MRDVGVSTGKSGGEAVRYKIEIIRQSNGIISWSMQFDDKEGNPDRERTIRVAKNVFDALRALEARNDTPDREYQQLTTFQKGMLLIGERLTGTLRV